MTDAELIAAAGRVITDRPNGSYRAGGVGAALLTAGGHLHLGVCIDTDCSLGFCAEANAIGAMVTSGESRIARIVAVWLDDGVARIVPPCGRCREFIQQIDAGNWATEVLLPGSKVLPLADLLPHHDGFAFLE